MDPRIRIRTKMSWIRNTALEKKVLPMMREMMLVSTKVYTTLRLNEDEEEAFFSSRGNPVRFEHDRLIVLWHENLQS
jgi:hypothetical protein